jgi:hypothetical protein
VDEHTISPAGDPFSAVKQSQPIAVGLHELEERLAHELMEDEKRQELRDRVRRLRRRLGP